MYLSRVSLENFRNFESLDLSLNQGFVVFTGVNGMGKTNFLESLYLGLALRRFPESSFQQLFQDAKSFFRIKLAAQGSEEKRLEVFSEKTESGFRHRLLVDGQQSTRVKYSSNLPVISFLPQDLSLITRSPGGRRDFIDETLSQVSQIYRRSLSLYKKTLKQRNDLLRKISNNESTSEGLGVWNEQMAEHGSVVVKERERFFDFLNSNSDETLNQMSENLREVRFRYKGSGDSGRQGFLDLIERVSSKEKVLGRTMIGPHKDDFETIASEKIVKGYVSRGQMRTITLILKVLEQKYMEQELQKKPVLLLDDVFSEFDHPHQQRLVEFLKQQEQVFLTTAHFEEIKEFIPENSQVFNVNDGAVSLVNK